MPGGSASLKTIDPSLEGNYIYEDSAFAAKPVCYNDRYFTPEKINQDSMHFVTAMLHIENKVIYCFIHYYEVYDLTKIDTSGIYLQHSNSAEQRGNYIIFHRNITDTLLDLGKKDKLKYSDGYYYLNKCISKKDWQIVRLKITGENGLMLSFVNAIDKTQFANVQVVEKYMISPVLSVSDKEFDGFIKNGGFRESFNFSKLSDD
jgi:hypothetical protein